MKIAQVTPVYPPRGGIGTVAKDYADGLRRVGDEVEVFTPKYEKAIIKWGNAAVLLNLLWRLRGFDVIHLHYPFYGGGIFAAIASVLWRTPLVVTYHMKTKADGWLGMVFRLHRILIEPFILWRAQKVFVSSFDYAESVGLKHPRLEELPFAVDTQRFQPGESSDIFTFIFVGGMDEAHYFKGVGVILNALALLESEREWKAILVGGGGLREQYITQSEDLGLVGSVSFPGRVSNEELPRLFQNSDVHLLPSIDRSEAFGLVTLEAAASGLPSIVSDLPGVRTLVIESETGLIVRPGDVEDLARKMLKMIDNRNQVDMMGNAARERVLECYDQQVVLEKLRSAYGRVKVK